MDFIKIICCINGTLILALGMDVFMKWWESRSVVESKEGPIFYIKKSYEKIKKQQNEN